MILPGMNMLPLDPSLGTDAPPVSVFKAGFDCTIPVAKGVDVFSYAAAVVSEPLDVSGDVRAMTEDEVAERMEAMIHEKPRTWREIIAAFAAQPYPIVYRAFGRLRPRLGRMADRRPDYPYTFSDTDFVNEPKG